LLDVLNVAVARQLALKRQKALGAEPARGPAVLDARVLWGRAPRVLVLDASTSARMQLMSRLAGAGWEVQGAASIAQAKVWLAAWPPEIVVSDWALADGEARGLWRNEALSQERIKKQGAHGAPHWLLLTPCPSWWRLLLARWSGCAAVLDKPATPRAVLAVTDRLLRERLT